MKSCLKNYRLFSYLLMVLFSFSVSRLYSQNETRFSDASTERLVQISNHNLFISEKGNKDAKFTVVFESGAGGSSKDWTKVISMLPPEIRTIAYDRAGI